MVKAILFVAIFLIFAKPSFASSAVVNEFMPHPSSGDDWIEVYNPTSSSIDLNNWTLVDSTSTMKTLTGSVSAGGYITFDVSNRLNNSGDSIYLKDTSGATVDSHSYSSDPGTDKSLGRSPDGGSWATLTSSSKGSTNGSGSSTSSSPTPSPSSATSSSFTISDFPSSIDSTQIFSTKINLTLPDDPNSTYYLKGAFKKDGSSNYFGLTKVNSSWIKNGSSYSDQYKITTDSAGSWSGEIEIQPDVLDSGYEGSGNYIFKVARYTSSGSGPTWSNESNITINAKEITGGEDEENINLSKISSKSKKSTVSDSKEITDLPESVYSLENYKKNSTVAGTSTKSDDEETLVQDSKQINLFFILGGILVASGILIIIYFLIKNRVKS